MVGFREWKSVSAIITSAPITQRLPIIIEFAAQIDVSLIRTPFPIDIFALLLRVRIITGCATPRAVWSGIEQIKQLFPIEIKDPLYFVSIGRPNQVILSSKIIFFFSKNIV
jgi:hypothetical protein